MAIERQLQIDPIFSFAMHLVGKRSRIGRLIVQNRPLPRPLIYIDAVDATTDLKWLPIYDQFTLAGYLRVFNTPTVCRPDDLNFCEAI